MIPLKVLFVEDDQVDQLAFERFVEEHGLPITYVLAGSLSEAKCLVTQGEFDVIVADYSLGDGTAMDLLPFAPGVPMILITGAGDKEIAARAFTAGISDTLVKDIGRNYLEQLPERMEKVVGQRMRSGETLRENQALYRRVVDTANEGIWIADQDYNTSFVNRRMADMLGYQPEEMVGRPIHHFLFPEDLADFADRTSARGRTAPSQYERRFRHKDGSARWTILSTTATVNEQGEFRGSLAMVTDITERKRAEVELRESEERYRTLFERTANPILIIDIEGNYLSANETALQFLECTREELLLKNVRDTLPPGQQVTEVLRKIMPLWESGGRIEREYDVNGKIKVLDLTISPCMWNGRRAVFGLGTDITERKRAEEILRENEEKYRALVENANEAIIVTQDGALKFANPKASKLLGYSLEEAVGRPFVEFIHPDDRVLVAERYRKQLDGEVPAIVYPLRTIHKDGSIRWAEINSVLIAWEDRPAIMSYLTDITDRKRVEEDLRESEERYRRILDLSREGIWVLDEQFRTTFVNSQMSQWLGYPSEEIVGHPMEEFLFQEDIPDHQREMQERKMMIDSQYERRFQRKDGGVVWAIVSARALLRDDAFQGSFLMLTDLTERKRAEEELQKSEEMYRILVDNAAESLVVAQDGMLRFVNPKAEEVTGFSEAELMSVPFLELIHPEDRQRVGLNYQHRIRGEPAEDTYDFRILRKDDTYKWVEIHAVLISWQGAPATLNFLTDLTERKRAEEKLALNFETQAAMNALLGLSLESRTINEFLDRSLDLVLSLKWLTVESKGAIFLADKAGETLHLCVHKGLPKDLSAMCSTVPFGRCMCGRDAAARAVQFADRVDERHDTRYEGMSPHGHYCVPVLSGDHILGVINLYVKEGHTWSPWEEDFLKAVANTLAGTIERRRAEESLIETHEKLRQSWESTILVLASVAEMRDPYTAGHQQRVSELAQAIAQELGLPEAQVEGVRVAGLLHDLGKIQIPSETLSKPGKLTPIELMLIRTHSQSGYEILKPTVFPWPIAQFVLQHHERWDGSGYPAGLKGEEILLEARILAVADVVEAMSSHRPYRPAFGVHEALWEILQNKGTLYDAAVADACQRVFEERQFQFRSQVG